MPYVFRPVGKSRTSRLTSEPCLYCFFLNRTPRRSSHGIPHILAQSICFFYIKYCASYCLTVHGQNGHTSTCRRPSRGSDQELIAWHFVLVITPLLKDVWSDPVILFVQAVIEFWILSDYWSHDKETLWYIELSLNQINCFKPVFNQFCLNKRLPDEAGWFNFPKFHVLECYGPQLDCLNLMVPIVHEGIVEEKERKQNRTGYIYIEWCIPCWSWLCPCFPGIVRGSSGCLLVSLHVCCHNHLMQQDHEDCPILMQCNQAQVCSYTHVSCIGYSS